MVYARPAVLDNPILLAPATENGEIRSQLAEAQGQCVELAVNAGELNAEVEAPRRELAEFLRFDLRFFLFVASHAHCNWGVIIGICTNL
ncbi:hypothetical protein ASF32_21480 [Methylobacterium sp. Leaf91]|nr:hypothetical protein ASF24_10250 [Methylobacterium sp. Leaf86]KQO92678.1 hypothetical protein ASF32_21480 [Methylobacterium sp. Leaf91]